MRIANRIAHLPPYIFARVGQEIAQMRAQGVDVINLGIGSPDLAPPRHIIDALYKSALREDNHGYPGYYGTPELRQAIAEYYSRRFEITLNPKTEILPLIGSKEGIANIAFAFVDPGDVVLVPDPGYPTYRMGTLLAGGEPYPLPLLPENDFLPDLSAIPEDIAKRAKLMWLNYPNNPTGAVATLNFFTEAVDFAKKYDLLICHDNPYCDVTYDGFVAPSILQVTGAKEVSLEFNSLSKTYNMAGWRIGMVVGNEKAIEALARVKTNIDSGIFKPIQEAATIALLEDQNWVIERNLIYQKRRDTVLAFLPQIGLKARKPLASLYVWAQLPNNGEGATEFAWRTLRETGVWLTPGTAFGEVGDDHVRISLTVPEERLREAGERLKRRKI